jgi:ureidoglycolate lyase
VTPGDAPVAASSSGEPPRPRRLRVEPLDAEAFAPFGDVIAAGNARTRYPINDGTTERFHDLARIDVDRAGGRPVLSLFRAQPRAFPIRIAMLERHPLGSQAFVPLDPTLRYLVVVATAPDARPRAFLACNGQGVNYAPGTWHHPLLALDRESDFLVIDREGAGSNCDEAQLAMAWPIDSPD